MGCLGLEIVECQLRGVHHANEVDVQDGKFGLHWFVEGCVVNVDWVGAADTGVGDHDVDALGGGGGDGGFEEDELVGPFCYVTGNEADSTENCQSLGREMCKGWRTRGTQPRTSLRLPSLDLRWSQRLCQMSVLSRLRVTERL